MGDFMETGMKKLSTEAQLYRAGLVILPIGILAGYIARTWIIPILPESQCFMRLFFNLYCPGCGGTRSVNALLHGQIFQSLWYHPFVPYSVALYLAFMVSWTLAKLHLFGLKRGMQFRLGYMYGMLVIIGVNFLLKNVLKICFGIDMI